MGDGVGLVPGCVVSGGRASGLVRGSVGRVGRGMVTFELAVGVLSATFLTGVLAWTIGLVVLQGRCSDTAAQVARQLARDDQVAAQEAFGRGPRGAELAVDEGADVVSVVVTVDARFGAMGQVEVRGSAQMPREGR